MSELKEVKKLSTFKPGDKVFAKVKGYPLWPAVIIARASKKFQVRFYGTNERGFIKPEDCYFYLKHKEQFSTGSKKKEFKNALEQIEQDVREAGTDGENPPNNESSEKRKRSDSESSGTSNPKKAAPAPDSAQNSVLKGETSVLEDHGVDFYIVSERDLQNWITYGEKVSEKSEFYSTLPAYPRHHSTKQVFPVTLPSGATIALKLHKTPMPTFPNELQCASYDSQRAATLLGQKAALLRGEDIRDGDPDLFAADFALSGAEIDERVKRARAEAEARLMQRLEWESLLLVLDTKIKMALSLEKGDPLKAIGYLDKLLEIRTDEVMLKKHRALVPMLRCVRRYVGNLNEWKLADEEVEEFKKNAKSLRLKADEVYTKIQTVFKDLHEVGIDSYRFTMGYNALVAKFDEDCRSFGFQEQDVYYLIDEPYARQSILHRLDKTKQIQETVEDTGKENQVFN